MSTPGNGHVYKLEVLAAAQVRAARPAGRIEIVPTDSSLPIRVSFDYNPALVEKCRAIKNLHRESWFDGPTKSWRFPVSAMEQVLDSFPGFAMDGSMEALLAERAAARRHAEERERSKRQKTELLLAAAGDLSAPLPGGRQPYQHQADGVRWMFERHAEPDEELNGAIVADDMGLGKTTETLMAAKAYRAAFGAAIFVIAPPSVHDSAWRKDAREVDVPIELFSNHANRIPVPPPDGRPFVMIVDEAHHYQNITAARTKKMLELAAAPNCIACFPATGTPIKNGRPVNLYPLLKAVRHTLANSRREYERTYCAARATKFSRWDASGAAHLDVLHDRTRNVILRRLKKDCLDLPEKTRVMRKAELSEIAKARYNQKLKELVDSYMDRLRRGEISSGAEILVEMTQLRHAGSVGKAETAIDLAQELIEQGRKVVIFTEFDASVQMIRNALETFGAGVVTLTGETPQKLRGALIEQFQTDPKTNAFVGTVKAGGVGVTLTAADTVILVDRPWTPGDAVQAEDRCHRIGQHNNVTAIWLQHGEIDERVDDILLQKQERIDLVLEGKRKSMRGIESAADVARDIMNMLTGREDC